MVALDLSATFDTIDHSVLISRLEHTLGLGGLAPDWVQSYLSVRTSFVKIGGERSPTTFVATVVPQGSVCGPILFSLFISPLSNVISKYGIQCHQYANDIQLYIAVNSNNTAHTSTDMFTCTSDVYDWLLHNCVYLYVRCLRLAATQLSRT